MHFIETTIFTRRLLTILSDEEYRLLQEELNSRPDAGKEIKHSGGIRKIRWAAKGHGKRGGARVVYYWIVSRGVIFFLYIYGKNEQSDLTSDQLKQLRRVVSEELKETYDEERNI